ncbi:MAG: isoprenyl transferase [Peptostreptococcaceae bacterium]|nr:isoprenyl transferase [Peptostreptococcaceae bacterium]
MKINDKIPEHIAIIMDGNGRWAQKRGLPRTAGHKAGIEAIREVIENCSKEGIKYLTLYAFSTENWKRPQKEVSALMELLVYYLKKEINLLHKNNVRIRTIGDIAKLPLKAQNEIDSAITKTCSNTGLNVTLAINYGGRQELIQAIKKITVEYCENPDEINELTVSSHMETSEIPDPDLIIRPSGELRISNFLLWQMAYSEFWFSNVLWPDFNKDHLNDAIKSYSERKRRYGGLNAEEQQVKK